MQPDQIDGLVQQYAHQYGISVRQARLLVTNALGQEGSGKLLVFSLALLSQQVDIDVILKAMAYGEAAWYRSAEQVL
jgi:hypothetical protein